MRDTSVSDEDLAIVSAKEKLATLKDRPNYAQAMRKEAPATVFRVITFGAAVGCGGIIYACRLYVTAAWLQWFLMIVFLCFGVFFLLATIGLSPSMAGKPYGVAVLEKKLVDGRHFVTFLRENGERLELSAGDQLYDALRPGDLGVVRATGTTPDYGVDSFERL